MGVSILREGKRELALSETTYEIRKTGEKRAEFCREGEDPSVSTIFFGKVAIIRLWDIPPAVRRARLLDEKEIAELRMNEEGGWELYFAEHRGMKVQLYHLADRGIKAMLAPPESWAFIAAMKAENRTHRTHKKMRTHAARTRAPRRASKTS